MPIIPDQVKEIKRKMTVYIAESLAQQLDAYLAYRGCSREHVVTHALAYALGKDRGFQKHLAERGTQPDRRPGKARRSS